MATNLENSFMGQKDRDTKTLCSLIYPNTPSPKCLPPEIPFEPAKPLIFNVAYEGAKENVYIDDTTTVRVFVGNNPSRE